MNNPRVTSRDIRNISTARNKCALVMVANFSEEELVIPKATVFGIAEAREELIDRINAEGEPKPARSNDRQKRTNEFLYRKLLRGKLNHLPNEERKLIEPVLRLRPRVPR